MKLNAILLLSTLSLLLDRVLSTPTPHSTSELSNNTSPLFAPRQIITEGLCYKQPEWQRTWCLLTSLTTPGGHVSLYGFRPDCSLLGYMSSAPQHREWFDFYSQLKYVMVIFLTGPAASRWPILKYAGVQWHVGKGACRKDRSDDFICFLPFRCDQN